jgi:hypothetical protein
MTSPTPCPRNLPQHFNGCTCAPSVAANSEATGIDLQSGAYADLSAMAVLNAIAEAKRTGKPALIAHPVPDRIDLDEQRTGSMAGDYSVGAEPSIRYTWATGDDNEPFITVTETAWVSARLELDEPDPALDGGNHDLDYEAWEAAKETYEMWEADRDDRTCDCSVSSGRKGFGKDPAKCRAHGSPPLPEEPPSVVYAREEMTEWISHFDPNEPGSTEIRSEYEHGEGSAITFSSLVSAESAARAHLKTLDPSKYAPENWK